MTTRRAGLGFTMALAMAATMAWQPGEAAACGGMFCDGGPQSMPVDQSGENILYAVDSTAGTIETHVQIQYEGEASRFAWVLPVQSLPTFGVGSQPFFDALLKSTVPTYGYTTQNLCTPPGEFGAGGSSNGSAGSGGSGGSGGGGPAIVYQAQVGAFDITVLSGGTAKEVIDWLDTNGYQQNPLAEPILQDYLLKNYLFAAVKLTSGAGVDEIHPLVVTYHGDQPCIPLKLTAIAAKENMGVRAFFLGDRRWLASGDYKNIAINPARIDWTTFGSNYLDVVSHAVDSPLAMGRGFVTEYAGTSSVVPPGSVTNPLWDDKPLAGIDAYEAVSELSKQGLVSCTSPLNGNYTCTYGHPLVRGLLNEFLPVPAGLLEDNFYGCLLCNQDKIDKTAWNRAAFIAKFKERIVDPGKHAIEMLGKSPYLTRLFTTISPTEMTADPEFTRGEQTLPDVPANNLATRIIECSDTVMRLPDGREIVLPSGGGWVPWTDEMPWAQSISDVDAAGKLTTLFDDKPNVTAQIAAWNASQGWSGLSGAGGTAGAGGAGGAAGASAMGGAGGSAAGSSPGNAGTTSVVVPGGQGGSDPGPLRLEAGGGGGCQTGGGEGAGWLLALAAGFFARERRRRTTRV